MPQISLTDFVDIVSKSGKHKASKIKAIQRRPEYEPALDFYRGVRDGMVKLHQRGGNKNELSTIIDKTTDPRKLENYAQILSGYNKWWGKKALGWFAPAKTTYSYGGVDISINPELGLDIGGARHVVKLYFKTDPLSKAEADLITFLMESELRPHVTQIETMSVLDVRRSKLFTYTANSAADKRMINAEMAYIASYWEA